MLLRNTVHHQTHQISARLHVHRHTTGGGLRELGLTIQASVTTRTLPQMLPAAGRGPRHNIKRTNAE